MRTLQAALRYRFIVVILTLFTLLPHPSAAQDAVVTVNLTAPSAETTVLTEASQVRFTATASTASDGSDGVGIAAVTFTLRDSADTIVLETRDTAPPYCAVEDGTGCVALDNATVATLDDQAVQLTVTAEVLDGQTTTLQTPFTIARTTATDTASAATTLADTTAASQPVVRFTHPAENAAITQRSATGFAVTATDPAVGSRDGAGIAHIEFQFVHAGAVLYTRREWSPQYCMFGNTGPCQFLPSDLWNDLAADTYTLRARAITKRGVRSPWIERQVRIDPTRGGTPPNDAMQVFRPRELSRSEAEIVNPMRGLYRWNNQEYAPQPRPAYDSYERYAWRDLEPRRGHYDFSVIERDLEAAQRASRKHAIRIRAMIHGQGPVVPDYLVDAMGRGWWSHGTYVPDWNDTDFLARMHALIAELGRRYNGDPRLAWVDVGFYGNWGEWHTWPLSYPARNGALDMPSANKRRIVDQMAAAFPNTRLIMGSEDKDTLVYALRKYPTMGWRRDSLGSWIFDENSTFRNLRQRSAEWELVMERWQTAPIISEFISPNDQRDPDVYRLAQQQAEEYHVSLVSNGNTLAWNSLSHTGRTALLDLGKQAGYRLVLSDLAISQEPRPGDAFAVASRWLNRGNAPVYERWRPTLELRDDRGRVRWSGRLTVDLTDLLPSDSPTRVADRFRLPETFAPGTYDLVLVVRDPAGYREPLALAIQGRQEHGSYHLGRVVVEQAGQQEAAQRMHKPYHVWLPLIGMEN
jgi:predicted double-glycine peptidase